MPRYGLVVLVTLFLSACSSGYQSSAVSGGYSSVAHNSTYTDSMFPSYNRYNRHGFNRHAYRYPRHYMSIKKWKHSSRNYKHHSRNRHHNVVGHNKYRKRHSGW